MRKLIVLASLFVFASIAKAQPITGAGGLQRVIHDNTMTGEGTTPHPLSVVGAASYISGMLTAPNLVIASGLHTVTNYAGTGSIPDKAITAFSAAGAATFGYFVDSGATGVTVLNNVASIDPTYTQRRVTGICSDPFGIITIAQDGTVTCSTTTVGSARTITAGTMLSGGGDLSANRTINLADIATSTVIGRVAAGTGAPSALTTTQLTTLVNPFSSTLSGAVPASGGSASQYLNGAGGFTTPPGTGVTSVATGTGLTGGTITTTGTLSLSINGGVAQSCSASNAVTGISATGIETCSTLATLGAASGTGTANKVTKWNNTSGGLVDASLLDNGTTVSTTENADIGVATAATHTLEVAGTGQVIAAITDAGNAGGEVFVAANQDATNAGGALSFAFKNDGNTYARSAALKLLEVSGVGSGTGDLAFLTRNATGDTALTERMRIAAGGAVTIQQTLGVTGLSTLTGGFSAGANSIVTGTFGVTVPAAQTASIGVQLSDASTGQTASEQLFYPHSNGSFDATAVGRDNYVGYFEAHATRSAGAFLVRNFAGFFDASGGQANYALFTSAGDVLLNNGGGTFTAVAGINVNSQKITNCLNGTVSSDGACFGQIATGVNAAVTGSAPHVPVFTGANVIGNSAIYDDTGSSNFVFSRNGTPTTCGNTTGSIECFSLNPYSVDGNVYVDSKTATGGKTTFRAGSGAEAAATRNWLLVTNSTGATEFTQAGTFDTTLTSTGALTASSTAHIVGAATLDSTLGVTGLSTLGATIINGPTVPVNATGNLIVNDTATGQTLIDGRAITSIFAGTFNTTGGVANTYAVLASNTNTRSAGSNALTNIALYGSASGAQTNYALYTAAGDVSLATTSGATTIGTTGATTQIAASQVNFHGSAADSYFYFSNADTYIRGNGASTHVYIGDNGTSGTVEIAAQGATTNDYGQFAQTYTSTAIAGDAKGVSASNGGTFNTTAAGRNAYGLYVANSSAISSGANTLTSIGAYIDDTTSGANTTVYALYTDHGDVRLNGTNGQTAVEGPFTVNNFNSSTSGTSAQFNYTLTAQTGSGAAALGTNSGTFNTTSGAITAYGVKGSATSTRSAGANNLTNIGVFGTASGAQKNFAGYFDGDTRVKGHDTYNTASAPTGSGCSLDSNSTDVSGLVTMSAASTTLCTVTFNTTFPVTPFCVCSKGVNDGTAEAFVDCEGASTSTMTIHATAATVAGKFTYRCDAHE